MPPQGSVLKDDFTTGSFTNVSPFTGLTSTSLRWKGAQFRTGFFLEEDVFLEFGTWNEFDGIETWTLHPSDEWSRLRPNNTGARNHSMGLRSSGTDVMVPYQGPTGFGSIGFSGFETLPSSETYSWGTGFNSIFSESQEPVTNILGPWSSSEFEAISSTNLTYSLTSSACALIITQQGYCRDSGFFGDAVTYTPSSGPPWEPSWYSFSYSTFIILDETIGLNPIYLSMYSLKDKFKFVIKDAITGFPIDSIITDLRYSNHFYSFAGTTIVVGYSQIWNGGFFSMENRPGGNLGGWKIGSI
jgi:hypothetical protein